MTEQAKKLLERMDQASQTAAVMMTGLSSSIVLLMDWIRTVESRLAMIEVDLDFAEEDCDVEI